MTHRVFPRSRTVCGALAGGLPVRCHGAAVLVVAAVGDEPARSVTWPPAHPTNAGCHVQQRHQLGDVVTVPAGQRDDQGDAMPVDDHMLPAAGPARPAKVRCEPSFENPDMRAVNRSIVRVQQARRPQLGQQDLMQLRPDTQPRSSAEGSARPSYRCSRPVPQEHPANSHSCKALDVLPGLRPCPTWSVCGVVCSSRGLRQARERPGSCGGGVRIGG